jgi:heme exporter protein B
LQQRTALYGIVLYVVCVVFLIYMLNPDADGLQWSSLLWLNCVFLVIQGTAKYFSLNAKSRWQYYYSIYKPQAYIAAHLAYNILLILILASTALALFAFFIGFPAINKSLFVGLYLLGAISFSILFTFLTQLVAKVNSNSALLAVVGLPLIFPLILLISDLSVAAFLPVLTSGWQKFLLALCGLDVIMIAMSFILFSFVWTE